MTRREVGSVGKSALGAHEAVVLRPRSLVFRERYAKQATRLPVVSFGLLGTAGILWVPDVFERLRERLVVLAFILAIAGIAAGAVALREPWLRRTGRRGLALAVAAAVCALLLEPALSALRSP
jgi:multisubunit Na+/H+ antiporter MnhG subunit